VATLIRFSVRVPVLSEHTTETQPRVSTVESDLGRMRALRIWVAIRESVKATAIGIPSGINATTRAMRLVKIPTVLIKS
jgi:hypothetical protein